MTERKHSRRSFFQKAATSTAGLVLAPTLLAGKQKTEVQPSVSSDEQLWRNKQDGMHYRKLGRTGMMVSEIVLGTFPFTSPDNFPLFDESIEKGINYFDCAAAYSKGAVETNLGNYLKQSKKREKLFIATKLSGYYGAIDQLIKKEIETLTARDKRVLEKQAEDLIAERAVKRLGYHMNYFGNQERQFNLTYFRYLALEKIGVSENWRKKVKAHTNNLLKESLNRLQLDGVDVLHIPHGVAMPEMMDDLLGEIFQDFKKQGLTRAAAVSFHNDVTSNLLKATEVGFYDVAMFAYNIANHAGLESAMYRAKESGMGLIAMKVAKLFSMKNHPEWIESKLDATIPDKTLSHFAKSYLWALQNPNLSCCVSQMETSEILEDNLQVIGLKA